MSAPATSPPERPTSTRSRITNGSQLLPDVDGRSVWARILRDTLADLVAHCGGADRVSDPERMTARRSAALEAELIHMEAKFANLRSEGKDPATSDLDLYSRMSNTQRRLLEGLGMQARIRDVTPDLSAYLQAKRA